MAVIDDETLQMYIEESKEHLETIEADLLEIEEGGEDIDEELVNKVFRAAHSIKGGAGFLGLETIKELAHKIENVLDLVRNLQLVPTPEVVNTALVAFDRLGELLDDAVDSNGEEIESHITALKKLTDTDGSDAISQEAAVGTPEREPFFKLTQFDLDQSRHGGKNLYLLEYDLVHDVQNQGKSPLDIIHLLEDAGEIIDLQVGLMAVGDLDAEDIAPKIPLYVLFTSIIESDLIGSIIDLAPEKIKAIKPGEEQLTEALDIEDDREDQGSPEPDPPKKEEPQPQETQSPQEPAAAPPKAKEPPPAKPVKKAAKKKKAKKKSASQESLRVPVAVLDQLMNRAGELVLARNELNQALRGGEQKAMMAAGQRISQVTSELQEAIMLTRMQPVGNVFNKFTRVVHDLARSLNKEMDITLEGKEVDLDKTIIEGLADPLTHLVRNSCDHGIEPPDIREEKGKPRSGSIALRAFHESGQVIIEIEDDGKGLNREVLVQKAIDKGLISEEQAAVMSDKEKTGLIMMPGFSTAETITDVSGRGVGMDVVKTNLDQLGGEVELISEVDHGTTVRIKLPLTLAIIPSLLVSSCGERFAIPQVNVGELLRISAADIRKRIEKVGSADVLILRGELIPLLQLNNLLDLNATYFDPKSSTFKRDRRRGLADERLAVQDPEQEEAAPVDERRESAGDISIVVLQAGANKFGLVVETVHDTVEIVVKPLGRHLKSNLLYAGATIMGDGNVALILDVAGMAKKAALDAISEADMASKQKHEERDGATRQTLLLFHNAPNEFCAVPLHLVLRVEEIKTRDIEIMGGKKVIQYRGGSLPIYALEEVANVNPMEEREEVNIIIFVVAGHEIGLLAVPPLDIIEEALVIDEETLKQPGVAGSTIIKGNTTLLIDIFDLMESLNPDWFQQRAPLPETGVGGSGAKQILLAEDSMFFRAQVKQFLESEGHQVVAVEDGREAWEYLQNNPDDIGLVVTDLEMPNMDGFELTKNIKADAELSHLVVIALTSLAGEEDMEKGRAVGIDDYQVKLDKEKLLQGIHAHI